MPNLEVNVAAPAKVNLTLHVTGQRDDGYHLLDSLVVFADVGDSLNIKTDDTLSLTTIGPEAAHVPDGQDNLVLRVARLFKDIPGTSFALTKNLPVSSGIGGGSADAAAAFRGLMSMQKPAPEDGASAEVFDPFRTAVGRQLAHLGADIPVCVTSHNMRMRGIGDALEPLHDLPPIWAVLVNPRVAVPTPSVFKALKRKSNPAMQDDIPRFDGVHAFVEWLSAQRNDLEQPALSLAPEIGQVLDQLNANPDCLLARMSGSGATCFGLYAAKAAADAAAQAIEAARSHWWVRDTLLGSMAALAQPRFK